VTSLSQDVRRLGHADLHELAVEILEREHGFVFRARGRSMRPFICDGDTVHVTPVRPEQLRVGDIVLFRTAGETLLAHRIVGCIQTESGSSWVTRGDALFASDAAFHADRLLGRVSCRTRDRRSVRLDCGWRRWAGLAWGKSVRARAIMRRVRRLLQRTLSGRTHDM
jgi:hypothetical protein